MRIVIFLLLWVVTAIPIVAQAQFTYATNNGAITVTGYNGSDGTVAIPNTINGYAVAVIGDWAFYATSVTNVLIPDSVTNIGDGAFFNCESLTNVTLGSGVTSVGDWAFGFCPTLASICCRGNAPSLGGADVFYGNEAAIYYLAGATGWGFMFHGHPAIPRNAPVPFDYATNSDGITLAITGYAGSDSEVIIPSSINFLPVTSFGNNAFDSVNMTNIIIPNIVTNLGDSAFNNCVNLTGIVIPSRVKQTGNFTFDGCSRLANVTIPASVTKIGDGAFAGCSSLTSIIIPSSVTSIGSEAFDNSGLTNITIPDSVVFIDGLAFVNCYKLATVKLPNTITSISYLMFAECDNLTQITIPDGITNIGTAAFYDCYKLTAIYFEGNAPSTGDQVFNYSNPTIYYRPGTIGWAEHFDGLPTALTPLSYPVIVDSPNFGVQTKRFGFTIFWATNTPVIVEASTNLLDWQPVQTNTLTTGSAYFSDPQQTNYPSRFYRLRSL